jgi:rhombotail lipoprotein
MKNFLLGSLKLCVVASAFVATAAGCASRNSNAAPAMPPAQVITTPRVLETSLYAKDPGGGLSESDLQTVLSTPIDLQLPARLGVVPLSAPFDPKGPVSISTRTIAAKDLSAGLMEAPYFTQISDVTTELPNVGGLEGLRTIAARYRVRYLLLYSERFEDATHLNGWAWLYPTVVGMFLAPGVTVESHGIAQADLLDVRTGTILFSVIQPMRVHEKELMIGAARAHSEAQVEALGLAAKSLAKLVIKQTAALVRAGEEGAQKKPKTLIIPAPIATNP